MRNKIYLIIFLIYTTFSLGSTQNKLDSLLFGEYEYSTVEKNDDLKIVQAVKVTNVDPIKAKDQYSTRVIEKLYDTLFIFDKEGNIKPYLAESWKWKNDRTLLVKLKKNIFFHNGEEMTALDVKKSFDRLISKGVFKDLFDDVENIKVISNDEVEFKLKGKNNMFLSMLTYQMCSIVKEENGIVIGSGPYILKKMNNKEIVLEKNGKYYKKNYGPKEVTLTFEGSERRRVISFYNESVDGVADVTNKNILQAKKEGLINDDTLEIVNDDINTITLLFGKKNNIFKSRESREAIQEGIDTRELARNILGSQEATTFFPPNFFKAKLSKIDNNFNKKDSKNKIKELGLNKLKIELSVLNDSTSLELAKKIKEQLKEVGLNIIIIPYQQEAYLMKLEKNDFELTLYDIVTNKKYLIYNLGRIMLYDTKDVDTYNAVKPFIDIMKNEKKEINREKVYDKIVYLMSKNVPYIPIVHNKTLYIGNDKMKQLRAKE